MKNKIKADKTLNHNYCTETNISCFTLTSYLPKHHSF